MHLKTQAAHNIEQILPLFFDLYPPAPAVGSSSEKKHNYWSLILISFLVLNISIVMIGAYK